MNSNAQSKNMNTLIIGAGESGALTVRRMLDGVSDMPGIPVVAVDDDPAKLGLDVHGIKVEGSREDIPRLVKEHGVEQIVFAIPSASRDNRMAIYDICLHTESRILTIPQIKGTPIPEVGPTPLKPMQISDLLSREEAILGVEFVSGCIDGKTVLVTGGGGSIGSEICRQLANLDPARVVIFDIYENTAYELYRELVDGHGNDSVEWVVEIGSIRDEERLSNLFDKYQPQVVFHAAAHKHVPLMERNPREAVLNNVFGTMNVIRQAVLHEAERFVFISTDKAVNPTTVMGATKRMGEMLVQCCVKQSKTVFTAVRFGNVLGSHGSVVPLFERQIREGGPVTVTHRDVTRYFMTIPEASKLVITAGALAKGGEIFILDMGEPVRIYDLAERMIKLSGYVPHEDIQIKVTGLRAGEKLYEELLMDEEDVLPTDTKGIMLSAAEPVSVEEIQRKVSQLETVLSGSDSDMVACLAHVVETYVPDGFGA